MSTPDDHETKVCCGQVLEEAFTTNALYVNPLVDVRLEAAFTSPLGQRQTVEGFWDGSGTWRVRFCPEQTGMWQWRTVCSNPDDAGLHRRAGSFHCVPYEGDNPLPHHGSLRLSVDRHHLVHRDGVPFFWLADTAWNGALKAAAEDWDTYLRRRAEQQFTVIQFVTTQWRANREVEAFTLQDGLRVVPEHFRHLDERLKAINQHGMIAAPVMLWALTKHDPGHYLSEPHAITLGRYMKARWGAYQVVWILGGDGHYEGRKAERWHRIGRAVFGTASCLGRASASTPPTFARESTGTADLRVDGRRLVTMHPCGQSWVTEEFRHESWFGFHGYQSGHGDSEAALWWLLNGPPGKPWQSEPVHPIINLEPNYETHRAYESGQRFTDYHVRRAAYWSLLSAPPAGITYGNNSIWWWGEEPQVPLDHEALGTVQPWHEGLELPGLRSMTLLRNFLDGFPWWRMRPAQHLLATQPGAMDPRRFVTVAATSDGALAVAYLPAGGHVDLRLDTMSWPLRASWFDPRTGECAEAGEAVAPQVALSAPDGQDWVLLLAKQPAVS